MKKLCKIVWISVLLTGLCNQSHAMGNVISGRDFFFSGVYTGLAGFPLNPSYFSHPDTVVFYIVGDTACTGYVENALLNYHLDFSVVPGNTTILKVPDSIAKIFLLEDGYDFSNKGVFIHTEHDVFVFVQHFANTSYCPEHIEWSYCTHLISPLFLPFPNYKTPLWPIPYNSVTHLDMQTDMLINDYRKDDPGIIYIITSLEDSLRIFYHLQKGGTANMEETNDTILLPRKGESIVVSLRLATAFQFHTNCKRVIGQFYSGTSHLICNMDIVDLPSTPIVAPCYSLLPQYFPMTKSREYLSGRDYLCKKLWNNRFDKGLSLCNYYIYSKMQYGAVIFPPLQFSGASAYNYNEYYDDYLNQLNLLIQSDPETFLSCCSSSYIYSNTSYGLYTGNHRRYWGDTAVYVDVPYTFLRFPEPKIFDFNDGPFYKVKKTSRPGYELFGYLVDPYGYEKDACQTFTSLQPTERMVKKWLYPTTRDNLKREFFTDTLTTGFTTCDSMYVDVQIYTHEDGIGSTYFNGQLIPATAFDSFPMTAGEYWVTQLYFYNDDIPELISIENEHGFSAYVDEFGYDVKPAPAGHYEIDDITSLYYYHNGASGSFSTDAYQDCYTGLSPHNNDTVYRCVGDTLNLRWEATLDSVPVEWIFNGDSYMASELQFLLPTVDTLTAQLVLHYDGCPDTSTTFIVVVPPPTLEVCHDDTLCHGAQLSVQQPNVLSYLWSTGAHTPAITVDSAGTYSVTVTNLGCKAESDLFTIDLYPQSSVEFGNDSTLCELATLLLDATQPHPAQYVWQDQSTNATYTVYEDGQYWVVVTDHCLGASDTIAIGYLSDFTVDLGPDTTICEGRTLLLSAENPFCDYEWQDGSTQPTYLVRHPGTYSVTASNQCFEHGDDIVVEYEPCDQELWLPNSFTPDGDGLNDLFLPVFAYPDEVESFEMTIYDRWGMVQFMTRNMYAGWDAAGMPIGTYVVFIRYKSRGHETRDVTGSVTVVR